MKSIFAGFSDSIYIQALLCALVSTAQVSAQGISTVGEIYDYEINDVFHTVEHGSSVSSSFYAYRNILITDKFYSSEGDTVFYERSVWMYWAGSDNPGGSTDLYVNTVFYTHLNDLIHNGYIDTVYVTETYNWRKLNYNYTSHYPFGSETDRYIEGCGGSYFDNILITDDTDAHHSLQLIYFKKGTEEWGTPHYVTGVETLTSKSKLRIYPNPASDKLQIDLPIPNHKPCSGTIFSSTGQRIQEFAFSSVETMQLDVSTLDRGIYMIQLITDDISYGGTFIKN